jgi:ankyrin repeat protein
VQGFVGVIKLLVAHNADVNAKGPNDWTPLHHAAHDGRLDLVDALLAAGNSGKVKVNVVAQTDMGATPMFLAAQNCHREVVERFATYSSTLTTRQKDGWAPIHVAASLGHVTILEALLANSAALVDYSSAGGLTSLHIAAQFGHSHVIDVLIKKGAKVNMEAASDKSTALHLACEQGHVNVVKQLLANNALIDAQNAQGDTSLMRAVVAANQAMLELLLDAPAGVKANPNLADNEGQTPLMLACKKNEQELALVLINRGRADVNAQDMNGMTCLHHVCRLGLVRLCQLLLQAGASISLTDTVGRTALHVVCQHGQRECLSALRTGAGKTFEVDVQTKSGFTPLYLAAQGGHLRVGDIH